METRLIPEVQDLTYLRWSHIRSSSGTAGSLLKSESILNNKKFYYKLSNFEPGIGITGHESVNEFIVDRLLTLLGIEHLHYQLIHAAVEVDGKEYLTWLCASENFRQPGESKIALDDYYRTNAQKGESHYDFCVRMGWKNYIDTMLAVDYLILNRDRHGANIEVMRGSRNRTLRIAPLFDHGLSLLFSCHNDEAIHNFDVMADRPCQNFIGTGSCLSNLSFLSDKKSALHGSLCESDRNTLLDGLNEVLSDAHCDAIWNMIWRRYTFYESL